MNQPVLLKNLRGLDGFSDDAFIRLKQLIDLHVIPFSASTYWRKVKQGEFPTPEKISEQITASRVRKIRDWARDPAGYKTSAQPSQHSPIPDSDMPKRQRTGAKRSSTAPVNKPKKTAV